MTSHRWIAGLVAGAALAGGASAQTEDQYGLLLPQPGTAGIDYKFGLEGRYEEETGLIQGDLFLPVSTSDSSAFFVNGGARFRFDVDDEDDDNIPEDLADTVFDFDFDDEDAWSGFIGAGYRAYVGDSSILGANAYFEGGEISAVGTDDDEDFYMATVGAEYQQIFNFESATTLNIGLNGYIPFEDYTDPGGVNDIEVFILNGRAPRLGADLFATLGTNFTSADVRLEGTAGGFYYEGQDDGDEGDGTGIFEFSEGDDLPGAVGELALTYYGIDGFNIKGLGGVRWADMTAGDDDDVEWYAGLRAELAFGGDTQVERQVTRTETVPGSPIVPERDCAVVRQPDGTTTYDCSQRVVTDAGAIRDTKGTKGVVYEAEPLPPAPPTTRTVTETVVDTIPGLPVPSPRRHLGWGGPLVPYDIDLDSLDTDS